jgi:hypothetical protein
VSVGEPFVDFSISNLLRVLSLTFQNTCFPAWLGGVNRMYMSVTASANILELETLARLVREGEVKVVIDSCWTMEDVMKVNAHYILRFCLNEAD